MRGIARVDFLCSENELYVNELNTIPWIAVEVPSSLILPSRSWNY